MNILTLKSFYLGICFLALFLPYVTTQTYLTTLYQNVGFISFSLIYLPYALTSLVSPFIGKHLGVKMSILLGSLTYVIWIASVASNNFIFLIISSIINGIGCGLLWVHQGIYINKLIVEATKQNFSKVGNLTGIFFTIYSGNLFLGSSVSIILQEIDITVSTFIWIFFGIGVVAWTLLFFVPWPYNDSWNIWWNFLPVHTPSGVPEIFKEKDVENQFTLPSNGAPQSISGLVSIATSALSAAEIDLKDQDKTPDAVIYQEQIAEGLDISQINVAPVVKASIEIGLNHSKTFEDHLNNLLRTIKLPGFFNLIPLFVLLGFSVIFSYGTLPLLISVPSITEVAKLFISYGVLSVISSYIWGKIYDTKGENWVFLTGVIILFVQYLTILSRISWLIEFPEWSWYVHGGISGMIDTALISLVNIIISKKYDPDDTPYLFAWYRFFYCLSLALGSWLNTILNFVIILVIILVLAILMVISYLFHTRAHK